MRKLPTILLSALLIFSACNRKDKNDCSEAICTLIFASINVKVVDQNGAPIVVNNISTVNTITNDTMFFDQPSRSSGEYVVLDDSYVERMYNRSVDFILVGKESASGPTLFAEPYTIGADCCHVSKGSGKDVITLNR